MPIKPDPSLIHTMLVTQIIDKQKKFNSASGERQKFVVRFAEDYQAEYVPLVGKFDHNLVKENELLSFKITYRKEFGDEIEPVPLQLAPQQGQPTAQPVVPRLLSMQGHPASIAIMAAKDIAVGKSANDGESFSMSDMLADAETILEWLLSKTPQQ